MPRTGGLRPCNILLKKHDLDINAMIFVR